MAQPTPTSGSEPLSQAELDQLNALAARKAAAEAAQRDQNRKDRLAALQPLDKLVKLVMTDKVSDAIDSILNDASIDFDNKQKVQNFKLSLDYNLGGIQSNLDQLSTPIVPAPAE